MLERLHIRNYRVFNDLKIDRLSRINLIAGKNNSGKTSPPGLKTRAWAAL